MKLWHVKVLPSNRQSKTRCFAVAADTYLEAINKVIKNYPRLKCRYTETKEITIGVIPL